MVTVEVRVACASLPFFSTPEAIAASFPQIRVSNAALLWRTFVAQRQAVTG
jgi:hypothetical protein